MTIFGAFDSKTKLLEKSMEDWKTDMSAGEEILGKVNIRHEIFQGDRFLL